MDSMSTPAAAVRKIVILGSTGSIGRQALDVVRSHRDRFQVIGLATGTDRAALAGQAAEFGVTATAVGTDGAVDLAAHPDADVVLNAIVGAAGLRASLAALRAGIDLALANKESLVAGGELCLAAARRSGARIIPVDSEHWALTQCLEGRDRSSVRRIVLTASGGPFRTQLVLDDVTPEEALAHPTWAMGPKITIDSATLMNKGLEVIEAHFLFGFDFEHIGIVVHPQSIVHGIVENADGSMLLQAAPTDMRIPIRAALAHPDHVAAPAEGLDLGAVGSLTFEGVDHDRFPAVSLAYEAGRQGATYPAALNAANEEAVGAFLSGLLSFVGISHVIEATLSGHRPGDPLDLDDVLEADAAARAAVRGIIRTRNAVERSDPGVVRRANRAAFLALEPSEAVPTRRSLEREEP
jgi:1-deoxy-D-xylulose-5-phosphate reductoisomerase